MTLPKEKRIAFTLDLEADYAGCTKEYQILNNPSAIEEILSQLFSHGIKLTVFVVGEIIERFPHIIKLFEKYKCEFEAHSYSHTVLNPDLEYEIKKAKQAYRNYFRKDPIGYRAPQGRITAQMYRLLEQNGFLYDSSIFPSYYPNPARYLFCEKNIHKVPNSTITEIPLTSITPLRITLSVSYLKLLGTRCFSVFFKLFPLPDIICFNGHLHDFIVAEQSYQKLNLFWKSIYGRNKYSGLQFCLWFLRYIKNQGYQFCYLSEIYNHFKSTKQIKQI